MTKEQALEILRQPDRIGCNMIKANDENSCKFNQESLEALNMAIESVEKLEKIEQIVNEKGNIWSASVDARLKEILEQE